MHISRIALLLPVMLSACGEEPSVISGTFLDTSITGQVWIDEEVDRFDIAGGAFTLEGERRDTLDLQFATADGETGWMRILDLPGGAELTLDGIWLEGGRAFATDATAGEGQVVNVNGFRMGSLAGVGDGSIVEGTLLAIGDDGESLFVRPNDANLPDLRVAVGQGTVVQGPNDTPSSLERLEFGDSISVAGEVEGRYLMAAEVTLPQSATTAVSEAVEPSEPVPAEERGNDGADNREEARQDEERGRSGNPARGRGFRTGRRGGS